MKAIEGKENAVDFIENYKFDDAVLEWFDWYIETHLEYKLSDDEIQVVVEGLKDYLIFVVISPQAVAAASKLVDELFHVFILHTELYQAFCKGVGQFIHHYPIRKKVVLGNETPLENIEYNDHYQSIIRTYCLACQASDLDPLTTNQVPYLFKVDSILPEKHAALFDIKFFQSVLPKLGVHNFIIQE
ncbi:MULTISPECIES: hypothetical protein [Pseudoalteromonas]|uniref:hypothetical protein n=1 Tax=Pseudoalteromonas TaxID=53246 RepID=UPI001EF4204C|nr:MULTISPECIES: hypothetical protein [Pseudoalteromonas]MCG7541560.1 hypothetical protein [Pseudoalteromonas sp. OF7H-1]MCG9769230.1 hypothetical protein [Pseudoalteromonas piscicida]